MGEDTLGKSALHAHSSNIVGQLYNGHALETGDDDQCQGRLFWVALVMRDRIKGMEDFCHCPSRWVGLDLDRVIDDECECGDEEIYSRN